MRLQDLRFAGLPAGSQQMLVSLVNTVENKHPFSRGHSTRVMRYSASLAIIAGVPGADIPGFALGAFLHDIGKVAIPDAILYKTGPLTADEQATIQEHPRIGANMISPLFDSLDPRITDVVRYHHERIDGGGYPEQLSAEALPLWSRICSVADVWDAMTSPRAYHPALSRETALMELSQCKGTHLDPALTELFIDWINSERPHFVASFA